MKDRIHYLFIVVLGLLFTACSKQTSEELLFKSEDQSTTIRVKGEKGSLMSPWLTTMRVQYQAYDDSIRFEVYASEISEKTVHFQTVQNGEYHVVFDQHDTPLKVIITAKSGKLIIHKPDQYQKE